MIVLHHVGWHFVHPNDFEVLRPNGREDWLFLLFQSPAQVCLNAAWQPVQAGSGIIYPPGMPQHYRAWQVPFRNDWIHFFPDSGFPSLLERLGLPVGVPFLCPDPRDISSSLRQISEESQLSSPLTEELLDLEIRRLFLKLSQSLQWTPSLPDQPYLGAFQKLRSEIYNAPYQNWRVSQLSERLNLSPSYFQHLYHTLFSTSVGADIIASRLSYARYLLESASFSVGYIASQCGYENPEHFMRQFKKYMGVTPTQYRKQHGNQA